MLSMWIAALCADFCKYLYAPVLVLTVTLLQDWITNKLLLLLLVAVKTTCFIVIIATGTDTDSAGLSDRITESDWSSF